VGGQVIEVTNGRSGVVSVARVHRRLFSPRTPATGTLRVAAACVLILIAALLSPAGPAAAQTPEPKPCQVFAPCTPTDGPWVSSPSGDQAIWTVECTDALAAAVGSDVIFKGLEVPVGIEVSGGLGPGDHQLTFEPILPGLFNPSLTWQPAIGCSPTGAGFSPLGAAAGLRRAYDRRVRSVRVRPNAAARLRLGCGRGERLVRSGSGIGFYTRRPPSKRVLRAMEHRHRRSGRITRTFLATPPGVGDDERVQLQVTVLCAPASGRAMPSQVPYSTPRPCAEFTACMPVLGPWVTAPANGGADAWPIKCPTGQWAEGADAVFQDNAIHGVGVQTNFSDGPGLSDQLVFGVLPDQHWMIFKPGIGCLPKGGTAGASALRQPPPVGPLRWHVRETRIRPGADVRLRLGCARGERLVRSGSGIGFYTRRPPAKRVVEALAHRHRRSGRITRTSVTGSPGVGDDERVELRVSVLCER
jgi:hypothetical protein